MSATLEFFKKNVYLQTALQIGNRTLMQRDVAWDFSRSYRSWNKHGLGLSWPMCSMGTELERI